MENKICEYADYHMQKEEQFEKEQLSNPIDLQTKRVYNYSKGLCLVNVLKKEAGKKSASGYDMYLCKLRD